MGEKGSAFNIKIIANLLNLSERRVKQLTSEGIIQETTPNFYKLTSTVNSYIKYLQSMISDKNLTSDYNTEKAKLTRVKREDAELEYKVKKNELHRAEDIEFIMTTMFTAFKTKLLSIPYKILPEILSLTDDKNKKDKLIEILTNSVIEALNELSEYSPDMFNEDKYLNSEEDD